MSDIYDALQSEEIYIKQMVKIKGSCSHQLQLQSKKKARSLSVAVSYMLSEI